MSTHEPITTHLDHDAIERFEGLADVIGYGHDWLLVDDRHTRWWCRAADITADLIDAYEHDRAALDRLPASASEIERDNAHRQRMGAWTELCQAIPPYRDDEVPPRLVDEARDDLRLDDDDDVAAGW